MEINYPHMCRDEHQEIGHRDSEHERCPLCRANDRTAELEAALANLMQKSANHIIAGHPINADALAALRDAERVLVKGNVTRP